MHRGGRGYEGGKGSGKESGSNSWRGNGGGGGSNSGGGGNGWRGGGGSNTWNNYDRDDSGGRAAPREAPEPPAPGNGNGDELASAVCERLEKRVAGVQKEFMQALHQKSQKENDKFDLIFGILSELQNRQAQLEDLAQSISAQSSGMGSGMAMRPMAPQFSSGGYSQMGSQMQQLGMAMQQPMQQYNGMQPMQQMNADGSQVMMMQQVQVVQMVPQQMQQQMPQQNTMGQGGFPSQDQLPVPPPPADDRATGSASSAAASEALAAAESSQPAESSSSKAWDKDRRWKVTHLEEGEPIPVVSTNEPYGPGIGREAPEDIVLQWLRNGDVVRQMGHSKKIKGYMVMPVRVVNEDTAEDEEIEGFVTRRSVDKARDGGDIIWFEEVDPPVDREDRKDRWKPGAPRRDS